MFFKIGIIAEIQKETLLIGKSTCFTCIHIGQRILVEKAIFSHVLHTKLMSQLFELQLETWTTYHFPRNKV